MDITKLGASHCDNGSRMKRGRQALCDYCAWRDRYEVIKYLGSKRTLVPAILEAVRACQPHGSFGTVIDLFAGTSRVGHALKRAGYRVIANDHNAYARTLALCYIQADAEDVAREAEMLVREFNGVIGGAGALTPGYFTETFCVKSRFFHPSNGERIDAIRAAIAKKSLGPELEAVMLVALMEAADRVDSTTGVQMAYLKAWASRALKPMELRIPDLLPRAAAGKGEAHGLDAVEAARAIGERLEADIAYLDPPYNQHSYLRNYHIWETLVRGDEPGVYGVACKREDCRTRISAFNSRRGIAAEMARVIETVRAKALVVSFNNEGFIGRAEMEAMLSTRGVVRTLEHDYKRYVGAQIGIYNPQGRKVGQVSHLRNTEYLYIVTSDAAAIDSIDALRARLAEQAEPPAPLR